MVDVPLHAKVACADGSCGESVAVIVDPTTQTVTHFVVRDKSLPDSDQRLVPLEHVVESTSDLIRLRCTRDELAEMESFIETHYVEAQQTLPMYVPYSVDETYMFPYVTYAGTVDVPVDVERVPPGELAVHRGTQVEATDGHVGDVGELVVDPATGHITHLVLREGHRWGKKEVTLPLSAVDFVQQDTVYLKLDRRAIGLLPSIPIKRSYVTGKAEIDLVAKVFDEPDGADKALEFVEELHHRQVIKIHNAAVLVKDKEGHTTLKDTRDIDPKKGRLLGAITGGLIGLLAGPGGAVIGALAGAGAGSQAAKRIDFGFSDKFLANLQEHLKPDSSALVVLVEHEWATSLSEALAGEEGIIVQQTLTDALVEQFLDAGEAE